MDEVRIEITSTDMKRGQRGSVSACPIASAIKKKFDTRVAVRRTFLTMHGKRFRITSSLTRWISRYDKGLIVPFISIVFQRGCKVGIRTDKSRRFNTRFKYETNEVLD